MSDGEIKQVYIVTHGEYSDYGISSVWLTLQDAQDAAGTHSSVEVYPVGANERTLGNFTRSAQVEYGTGKVKESDAQNGPHLTEDQASVLCWPETMTSYGGQLGIRITASTKERADKVFSEVKARVLADISLGLPMEVIADRKYGPSGWVSTR